jgi:hypothetical protein
MSDHLTTTIKPIHPSIPPFPVAKNRPDHVSGSQASNVILDSLVVRIAKAIRHKSTATTCFPRLQEAALSGNVNVVFAATYSRTLRVDPGTTSSGLNARHFSSKADEAMTGADSRRSSEETSRPRIMAGTHQVARSSLPAVVCFPTARSLGRKVKCAMKMRVPPPMF